MARSMFSFGIFSFLAARIAVRKRGFEFGSPPPMRAAIEISRMILVKTRPRFASVAAFLCLIVAHFECRTLHILVVSRGRGLAVVIDGRIFAPQSGFAECRPYRRRTSREPRYGRQESRPS